MPRQTEHHFSRGHSVGIDPVHVGKGTAADVMVDADQDTIFQSLEPRAMDAVALENNGRLIAAGHAA